MKLTELLERDEICLASVRIDGQRHTDGWTYVAMDVVLYRMDTDTRIKVSWGQGIGLKGDPAAEDVMSSLVLEAQSVHGTNPESEEGFQSWAAEYGHDSDSRKAFKAWQKVHHQAADLRTFLGNEFDDYMSCEVGW